MLSAGIYKDTLFKLSMNKKMLGIKPSKKFATSTHPQNNRHATPSNQTKDENLTA
jgi:hypothetical protein